MKSESRKCQNCKTEFIIEPDDFTFYKKIDVPAPTWCPDCRLVRRLAWFKLLRLYHRKCDLCGEKKICMYSPEANYRVHCIDCWWSDNWDPESYAQDYDSSRSFFEQFNQLMHEVPLRGLAISKQSAAASPYTNHCDNAKNAYLIFYSDYNENAQHGFYLQRSKDLLDTSIYWDSEQCYDSLNGFKNFQVHGSRGNVHTSLDCHFIRDAKNAQHCFGSSNLRNKKYVFFNQQLSKEEYQRRVDEIDLGSSKVYTEMKEKALQEWKKSVPLPCYDYMFNDNCTGSYVFYSKNCHECYDSGYCQNCKYVMLIKGDTRDSYDFTDWGKNAELIYDCITVGNNVSNVYFSQDVHSSHHIQYSKSCMNCAYLFGCSALRNKQYCIFNKQYSKEEYFKLVEKIKQRMIEDKEYGEFFPMKISPHDYNDSFAQMFSPKTEKEVKKLGLTWMSLPLSEYEVTKTAKDLSDHIKDVGEGILKDAIQCETCSRAYRVTKDELNFLKQHNFPLPRRCPFCRIEEKIKQWVKQMHLHDRTCDKCQKEFKASYNKEDAPNIYCHDCYFKEIL